MTNFAKLTTGLLLTAIATSPLTANARAWNRHHPERAEVNQRLANQNRRITAGVRDGQLTRGEAHALRANDRSIRAQERAAAAADGHHGHLTGAQIHTLNQEANANGAAIRTDRHQ